MLYSLNRTLIAQDERCGSTRCERGVSRAELDVDGHVISGGSVEMSLAPPVVAHSHLARSVRVSDYQTRLETRILGLSFKVSKLDVLNRSRGQKFRSYPLVQSRRQNVSLCRGLGVEDVVAVSESVWRPNV